MEIKLVFVSPLVEEMTRFPRSRDSLTFSAVVFFIAGIKRDRKWTQLTKYLVQVNATVEQSWTGALMTIRKIWNIVCVVMYY